MFAEITLTGWPGGFAIGVVAICFASLFIGWPEFISINKHYHCNKCEDDKDDKDDE